MTEANERARALWPAAANGDDERVFAASEAGRLEVVQVLLAGGADPHARSPSGETALHVAARRGHADVVAALLGAGADPRHRDRLGRTALVAACEAGAEATARLLVEGGAELDVVVSDTGDTPLGLAKRARKDDLCAFLVARGATERPIRRPAPGERLPITECDVCAYLPHRRELEWAHDPRDTPELELVHEVTATPDRYTTSRQMLKRCPLCGTHYQHDHSIDTEDSVATPPTVWHTFERHNLRVLCDVLRFAGKTAELAAHEASLPATVARFAAVVADAAPAIAEHVRPHIVESLVDARVLAHEWAGLTALLRHPQVAVAQATASDLLALVGAYRGLPRMARPSLQAVRDTLAPWLRANARVLVEAIDAIARSDEGAARDLRAGVERAKLV